MSSTKDNTKSICANCGKEDSKLKSCTACKLVKYCSRECQIAHRPQHKKVCKKRAAELYDEKLFKQPPLEFEDCPICFLRLPTLETGYRYKTCCGKVICSGCYYAPLYDDQGNEVDNKKCPFCRIPTPTTEEVEEIVKRTMKRVESDDPEAIHDLGCDYRDGSCGYPQDYDKALELWHRSAELGHAKSYLNIGCAYNHGQGVEVDKKRALYYWELAAMRGDETARYNLGIEEENVGNMDRALKHYMISARGGYNDSLQEIQDLFTNGYATKDDYTKALQLYQEYLGEIKSVQRDNAAAADESCQYY